ncbi:MAG: LuxR C-terminal-related transcriptional regulator [Pseudomonadota bacterium]
MPEERLTAREEEIAQAYASGETYQQIAERLCIAPSTVRTHLASIYRKLEVSSKLALHAQLSGSRHEAPADSDQAAIIADLALSLEEAIGRERALSEVLRIISGSDGEVERVIAALLGYALRLCDAEFGVLFESQPGGAFRASHSRGLPPAFEAWLTEAGSFVPDPATAIGRMAASREVVNILDVRAEAVFRRAEPLRRASVDLGGARSFAAIPMLAGARLVGAFTIYRQQLRPFDDKTLQLAQGFAGQSVIALENARLMSALRERTGGLSS